MPFLAPTGPLADSEFRPFPTSLACTFLSPSSFVWRMLLVRRSVNQESHMQASLKGAGTERGSSSSSLRVFLCSFILSPKCSFGLVHGQFLFQWSFTCQSLAVNARNCAKTTKLKSAMRPQFGTYFVLKFVHSRVWGEISSTASKVLSDCKVLFKHKKMAVNSR